LGKRSCIAMKRNHDQSMESTIGAATVLCCSCGVPMVPNQSMRCAQCLKSEVSIVDGISRQVVLPRCRNCSRYNKPPWTACEPESRELLGICLKRIRGIGKEVRLVDAAFVWTEEHSMRVRVKITVQKEVAHGSVLQQTLVVEFQVVNQQCDDCQKSFTPHQHNSIVQVRQKVPHRRTFCYLEQLILKSDAHAKVTSLKETREGLDFGFATKSHAQRFADFVSAHVPTNQTQSRHLISHDANSNTYAFKYTIMCDIAPICVDDIVHIPKGHSSALSGCSPLMLCHKVSNAVRLVDPTTLKSYDIPTQEYFKRTVHSVCRRDHLTEYTVLNVEPVEVNQEGTPARHNLPGKGKCMLADVEVARTSDLGRNDDRYIVRSHLGGFLRPGGKVMGYDLRTVNVSGIDGAPLEDGKHDIFLVKKVYKRNKKDRQWELKRLDKERNEGEEAIDDSADMEALRQDLEEDPELRRGVNMYRTGYEPQTTSPSAAKEKEDEEADEDEDEDAPEVPLAELLEGLQLGDD